MYRRRWQELDEEHSYPWPMGGGMFAANLFRFAWRYFIDVTFIAAPQTARFRPGFFA